MQAWHSSTRRAKQPPVRLEVDCYPVIIQNPSMARSFLGIAVIWIIDHQHASLQRSVFHKQLFSEKEVWLLQRARVTPRQRAGVLGTSRRSDWPQEMEERVLGHPSESVGMRWFLRSLGRTFLTPNGAIATGYAMYILMQLQVKNTRSLKTSPVRKVSSAEGFFWFSSAEKQRTTVNLQPSCHQVSYCCQSRGG